MNHAAQPHVALRYFAFIASRAYALQSQDAARWRSPEVNLSCAWRRALHWLFFSLSCFFACFWIMHPLLAHFDNAVNAASCPKNPCVDRPGPCGKVCLGLAMSPRSGPQFASCSSPRTLKFFPPISLEANKQQTHETHHLI